uniref:alpha-L-fucosidase n=1 Tax=Altererythrobacter segetis TaxID=1104773 RepID=UPI00140D3211|nr:alpha-L-fucosidase [Altererythrobacter segetis]
MTGFTKRDFLATPLVAALGVSSAAKAASDGCAPAPAQAAYDLPVAPGRFDARVESLRSYQAPDWYRDAKFGIWAHWGPQAVPRMGDWYARFMYVPGHPDYDAHVRKYGHPSEFGYKDVIKLWKAEKFDPAALMEKYAAAGAKYFVSMGVHHDNFDLWSSAHHRWNATKVGPMRDVVGEWRDEARQRGLRFGVSEHLGASHNWWWPSHQCDQFWPKLGVPYDGADPQYADLYHAAHNEPYLNRGGDWYTKDPRFHQIWYDRIRDLLDSYQPDLLYSDGGIPFGVVGRSLVAHMYNSSIARSGKLEAVYNCKDLGSGEFYKEACVQDVERGVMQGINPLPWQTDTSNGDWFYSDGYKYKTTGEVLTMLADIVSKNGNLLLNVVLYPDGSLPPESEQLLAELALWMQVNGEAIHGTRPWKVFGEGPTEAASGAFKESAAYTAQDIRFTAKGEAVYAITLGEPAWKVAITSLRKDNAHEKRPVRAVRLLGNRRSLAFRQTSAGLEVQLPPTLPTRHASALQITF